jgi:glycosyltransferase involved in cell wall biosynthesis
MSTVAFIAYHFPPKGGAGVQRSTKFVKHLSRCDIAAQVVTCIADTTASDKWTPSDDSLLNDIPNSIPIVRLPWPTNFNTQSIAGWTREVSKSIDINSIDAIIVSMSPFDDSLLAKALAKKAKRPWIADLRDPWALDEFQAHKTWLHRKAELRKMGRQLETASAIIMNTPEAAKQLQDSNIIPQDIPIYSITNGYDDADFSEEIEPHRNDKFTIVHTGHFHTSQGLRQQKRKLEYKLLGRTKKGVNFLSRSPYYLMQALDLWASRDERVAKYVRLKFIGPLSEDDQSIIQQSKISDIVEAPGYLSHTGSVKALQTADLLFLPMHSLPESERATIVPGKAYEYMASGVPILAAVPQGDAHDFLSQSGLGLTCAPDAPMQMAAILASQFNEWNRGERSHYPNTRYIDTFNRRTLTKQLAEIIKTTVGQRSR